MLLFAFGDWLMQLNEFLQHTPSVCLAFSLCLWVRPVYPHGLTIKNGALYYAKCDQHICMWLFSLFISMQYSPQLFVSLDCAYLLYFECTFFFTS